MIASLRTLVSQVRTQQPAAVAGKHSNAPVKGNAPDFRSLVRPIAKPPSGDPKPAELPRLGPMTADPNTHPAPPPPKPPAPVTSSPYMPAGFQGTVNLMNRAEHEQTMNAWLQNYTRWSNDNKTHVYEQAMYNWELNNQRCLDLGINPPPKPTPPALDPIEPKPAGFWFA